MTENHQSIYEIGDHDWRVLAQKAQGGDRVAYRNLLREIFPYIKAVLSGSLANQDWVEDIAQEVLVSVHKSLETYSADRPFKPWLSAIIGYRRTDFLRRHYKNRKAVEQVQIRTDIASDYVTNPIHAGEWKDIEDALGQLPRKQRKIVERMKIQGYSAKEVAKEMGMSDVAVKVSAHRAVNRLKDILG